MTTKGGMMPLQWLFFTMPFILSAGGLALFYVHSRLKSDVRQMEETARATERSFERIVQKLQKSVDELTAGRRDATEAAGMPLITGSGLNLTKRSQALKMHRLGQTPAQIAKSLALPQNEVDLLIKVQRIVLQNVS